MHAVRTNIIRFSLKISAIQKMEHTSLFPEWLTILKKTTRFALRLYTATLMAISLPVNPEVPP